MNFDFFNPVVDLSPFIAKMKNNELTLENILEEDDIVNDIKTNIKSEFIDFITNDKIKKLIDYSTKMPISDNHNIGYKYPFNATEILCSDNTNFQNKLMLETHLYSKESKIKDIKQKFEESKKIKKGGFISGLFKIMQKVENNDIENEDDVDSNNEGNDEINEDDFNNEEFIDDLISIDDNLYKNKNNNSGVIYENVDYLLKFLKESEEVQENYVLVGYFYKILNNLINMHMMKIVQYLFDYPKKDEFDILDTFVKHMNRKSMCDIVRKLIIFEDDSIIKFDDKKIFLFEKVLDELNLSEEKDKYNCICDCLYLIMDNSKFFEIFMTKNNLIQKIYDILINSYKNQNPKKAISIIQLLIKINENLLQRFEVGFTRNTINLTDANEFLYGSSIPQDKSISSQHHDNIEILKKFLLIIFEILEKNEFIFLSDFGTYTPEENGDMISTDFQKYKKIGLKKIKQTEYISTLIDILVNSQGAKYHENEIEKLIDIMDNKGIFWNLHDMFFLFPNSNLFQILYKRIMELVINENAPKNLINSFFKEKINQKRDLIEIYINKILSDNKSKPVFNPCFSFIITIMNNIYISQNQELRKIIEENKDIHVFIEVMVEDFNNFFNQKLLYNDVFDAFSNNSEQKVESFGKKNILEIFEENSNIYDKYKNGEDYKILLDEKKKRKEKEKKEQNKNNIISNFEKEDKLGVKYIDDLDDELEDEDPLFKVQKINLRNEKANFLALLNKPTEEVNKEKINDDDFNYHGRFNIDDLEEVEEYELNNNADNINLENEKINEDSTPNLDENKIYHIDYNKIVENNNNNANSNEEDSDKKDEKNIKEEGSDNKDDNNINNENN